MIFRTNISLRVREIRVARSILPTRREFGPPRWSTFFASRSLNKWTCTLSIDVQYIRYILHLDYTHNVKCRHIMAGELGCGALVSKSRCPNHFMKAILVMMLYYNLTEHFLLNMSHFGKILLSQNAHDRVFSQAGLCSTSWVHVLGTGRSGTTTILDMLRLVSQLHIRGETKLLKPALDLYTTVTVGTPETGFSLNEDTRGPMVHRAIKDTHLLLALQHWFLAINPLSSYDYARTDVLFRLQGGHIRAGPPEVY